MKDPGMLLVGCGLGIMTGRDKWDLIIGGTMILLGLSFLWAISDKVGKGE